MFELLNKGGWVMYPILLLSITALAIAIERVIFYISTSSRQDPACRLINEATEADEIKTVSEQRKAVAGIYGKVAAAYVENSTRPAEILEESVHLAAVQEMRKLEKHLPALSAIVVIAPLLGLLGTVLGMIDTFQGLSTAGGQPDVSALAGGIWIALLTTAFGLIVAIPAAAVHHLFQNLVDSRIADIEEMVSMLNIIFGGGCVSRFGKSAAGPHPADGKNRNPRVTTTSLAESREG